MINDGIENLYICWNIDIFFDIFNSLIVYLILLQFVLGIKDWFSLIISISISIIAIAENVLRDLQVEVDIDSAIDQHIHDRDDEEGAADVRTSWTSYIGDLVQQGRVGVGYPILVSGSR